MKSEDIEAVIRAITFECSNYEEKYFKNFNVQYYDGLVGQRTKIFYKKLVQYNHNCNHYIFYRCMYKAKQV